MKIVLTVCAALLIVGLGTSMVSAQVPYVQVFFNDGYSIGQKDCPDEPVGTVIDSFYVVAVNFDMWMAAIEYAIQMPPEMVPLGRTIPNDGLAFGNPWDPIAGISIAWPLPLNAFSPVSVTTVTFIWACSGCPVTNVPIVVVPSPVSGLLQALNWPDNEQTLGVGMTSLICATIPTEETTWGNIKALYDN
jgi:hypothetical protein